MARISKRQKALKLETTLETFNLKNGIERLKTINEKNNVKFDQSIDVAIRTSIDARRETLRGAFVLPHGTGKIPRVAVFTNSKIDEAKDAGADHVGGEDLCEKVQKGFLDFDICLATPDIMPSLGKIGKTLGSKGLMPNPKLGTVTVDIESKIRECKKGLVSFRIDKNGIIHAPMGRLSFSNDNLHENIFAFIEEIKRLRPSSIKPHAYLKSIYINTSMGNSVALDINNLSETS